ncbi:MAG: integrase core domain-containing protein [Verrucomicrobiales bacterium]
MDNVIIERLWRSVKHEWVLLHEYNTLPELNALLEEWIERYNTWRPHTANDGQTPWQAYRVESRQNWNATNWPRRRRNFSCIRPRPQA